jgi:hypothetical protein
MERTIRWKARCDESRTPGLEGGVRKRAIRHRALRLPNTGMQWKCLPVPHDTDGKPAIHYTTVYRVFAKWADDGSLWHTFVASVAHLAKAKHLDTSVLHGDGTNTVAKKGGMGLATRATNTRRARKSSPLRTTMALC